ncbi:MAG: GlsB/YeaQ/YmgE family stress response membrane protein [Arenimonas sp.]|nr:GlsB/YeaQ/YmgE family stress response membrane protein [Arenimonas sp.]MBP6626756.1 GlsB/YeaQ/YmgE family stress response membrane protein [Arenimonas sp.]
MNLLIFLLIGALAGWLAGMVVKGRGFGVLVNIIVGVLGAFFGGWLLPRLGITFGGSMGAFITAFLGAVILLAIIGLVKKA